MKTTIQIFALLLVTSFNFSSLHAQQDMLASGGEAVSTEGSVSYSIGQVAYTYDSGLTASVSQGVQQTYEVSSAGINDVGGASISCEVFPNPTTDFITVSVDDYPNSLSYALYDMNGKIISSQELSGNTTTIQMSALSSSSYFLKVSDNKTVVRTFKIIKK